MKKKLALALAASFVLTTGSAFAAEIPNPLDIKFDGSLSIQYRDDEKTTFAGVKQAPVNGLRETFVLNATKKLTDNLDFYARFTYQNLDKKVKGTADYIGTDGYNGAIDSFGFKLKQDNWNWVIGSQALTIGAQGLVYDNGFIGKHSLPYAVNASGKVGTVDTSVYYARTNYQTGLGDQDKFYGTNLGYAINDSAKVGAFYGRWVPGADWGIDNANAYGLDYSYKFNDKVSFAAEYAKTSADVDNKAYIAGISYAATANDTLGAKYYRSEGASQILDKNWGGMGTTPNPDTKGYILSLNHTISKDSSVAISYDSEKVITGDYGINNRDRTRATYTVSF